MDCTESTYDNHNIFQEKISLKQRIKEKIMKNLKIVKFVSILFFMAVLFVTFNSSNAFDNQLLKENTASGAVHAYWWDSTSDSTVEKPAYWWFGQNIENSDLDEVNYWWVNDFAAVKDVQCYWWLNGPANNYCQS